MPNKEAVEASQKARLQYVLARLNYSSVPINDKTVDTSMGTTAAKRNNKPQYAF